MKISFIIPFHNEEKNCLPMVERVLNYAKKNSLSFEIIAIDDKSTDSTGIILDKLHKKYPKIVFPIHRKKNDEIKGNTMGKALLEGTQKASGKYIIWTMGDLADDTNTYTDIINKLKLGYDLVFGSRYMPGGSRGNLDPLKAFLSSWGTVLAHLLFSVQVHDITNAFRGFRKDILKNISLDSSGFSISPEFAIKAHLVGFKLGEVPTIYTNRIEGISSFKLFRMTREYLRLYIDLLIKQKILKKYSNSRTHLSSTA